MSLLRAGAGGEVGTCDRRGGGRGRWAALRVVGSREGGRARKWHEIAISADCVEVDRAGLLLENPIVEGAFRWCWGRGQERGGEKKCAQAKGRKGIITRSRVRVRGRCGR